MISSFTGNGHLISSLCDNNENDADDDFLQGDSGGPFTVADSGSGAHTLVGAVSFGIGCARVGSKTLYSLHSSQSKFPKQLWHWMTLSIIKSSIKIARRASTESMQTCLSSELGSTRQLQRKEAPLSALRVI